MSPQQTLFAEWLAKWTAVRQENLTAGLASLINQQTQFTHDLPLYQARFEKIEELKKELRDNRQSSKKIPEARTIGQINNDGCQFFRSN